MALDFVWKIGGEAGYGILSAANIFARTFTRGGYNVFAASEYPSLIRGGHNTGAVRVCDSPVFSHLNSVNLLVALNGETIDLHKSELASPCAVLHDESVNVSQKSVGNGALLVPVPFNRFAQEKGEAKVMANTVAVGASLACVGYPFELLEGVLRDVFARKGEKVVSDNVEAGRAGFDWVKQKVGSGFATQISPVESRFPKAVVSGNEAIALGALCAGVRFHAQYPMTPVSGILHFLASRAKEFGVVVHQPEDEISAINEAIGAAYSGVRAMTATSGGGFCLMAEGVGLAGCTETPLVLVEGQRPGPSTGLPTKTSQGDLRFVLHASQDEFPRAVVAPGSVEECFYFAAEAFNVAEKFQVPVILLVDKYLAESARNVFLDESLVKIDRGLWASESELGADFKRYKFTDDGVSPRSRPGMKGGLFDAASDEHDEKGFLQDDPKLRAGMQEKRMKKIEACLKSIPAPTLQGNVDAKNLVLSWGSTKGPILEAMQRLKEKDGVACAFLQVAWMSPLHSSEIEKILSGAEKIVCVEHNYSGQLAGLVREKTGIEVNEKILRWDGLPLSADDVYARLKQKFS